MPALVNVEASVIEAPVSGAAALNCKAPISIRGNGLPVE